MSNFEKPTKHDPSSLSKQNVNSLEVNCQQTLGDRQKANNNKGFQAIPTELKEYIQWVTWILEKISLGTTTKRPYIAGLPKYPSNRAKVDDPTTWRDFETAWIDVENASNDKVLPKYPSNISKQIISKQKLLDIDVQKSVGYGIGFILTERDPYCFIDLDHCINANTGEIEPKSKQIIEKLSSYTEISQSGLGIHIIVKAELPEGSGNRKGNFEIYTQGRYCAMTGNLLNGYPRTIEERQEQVNQICNEIFGKPETKEPSITQPSTTNLSDQEIIDKASNAKNGLKFKLLMAGDISGYPSGSEADLALVDLIAFYTQDKGQILRIIEQSALYDKKWERADYQHRTIDKALSTLSERYNPSGNYGSIDKSNKAGDSVAEETEAEQKKADISRFFEDKTFTPSILADELKSEYDFIFTNGDLYLYQGGVYRPIGIEFIKNKCREKLQKASRINRINEVIAHIQDTTCVDGEKLNTYKYLINLENGMYDIKTEKIISHSKDYLSTIRIPVEYDPSVSYANISDWLESTLIDAECIQLACELFGYCLIPDTAMAKAFMLVGVGANGKSTFLNVLENFIGKDNVSKVPLQELSDHRFKRAELFGKLVNLFADLDNKALESTSYFKTIVTGDSIDAERKNQNPFSFRPFTRLVFSANEIPRSRDRSFAYYRRWCIIPFDKQFMGADDKKGLAEELSKPENLSALLNCALPELKRILERQTFSEPAKVKEALSEYEKQNDPVKAFVSECCQFDGLARVERGSLYDKFCQYCEETGFKTVNNRNFYQRMRIFQQIKELQQDDGKRVFIGIKISS